MTAINQAEQDAEHLRYLSIFHYIAAGITALWATFPIFHFIFGLVVLLGNFEFNIEPKGGPPPEIMGWFMVLFAGAWIAVGWGLTVCLIVAGRSLRQRRRYLFCMIVAGVTAALCTPLGTVLAVFTIIVLVRPSVKEAFEANAMAA